MNGPCVRAYRRRRSPTGSGTTSVNTSGTPTGSATPSASRSRPASSIAAHCSARSGGTPPSRTRIRRRAPSSSTSQPGTSSRTSGFVALGDLRRGERTVPSHGVGQLLERAGLPFGRAAAQLRLGAHDGVGVEQVGELGLAALAEQLGQQGRVERQGGGAALGQRGVAVVEELRGVAEQQGLRERGRLGGRDLDDPDPAGHDVAHERGERLGVEVVLEALADGLEQDREVGVLGRHGQQLRGPLPLLPERLAAVRPAPGEQQRAARGLAEPGAEHRRRAELGLAPRRAPRRDRPGGPRGRSPGPADSAQGSSTSEPSPASSMSGSRRTIPSSECIAAASTPYRSRSRAPMTIAHGACTRAPYGRVQDHPPVAELVAEPLDHEHDVRRELARSPRAARAGR